MHFPNFWKSIGRALAAVAKGAARAALWASQHQTVVQSVATIAGHPEIGVKIDTITGVINAIGYARSGSPLAAKQTS